MGWTRAKHPWVVYMHQDVYLSEGWDRQLTRQLREAERRFGPIGVAGVYGVGEVIAPVDMTQPLAAERIGWVVDRGRTLRDGPELPATVATLDELLLIVRRDAPLRFDPALGFHLYGGGSLSSGPRGGVGRGGARSFVPAQLAVGRAAGRVFPECTGVCSQMGPSPAGGHAVRDY